MFESSSSGPAKRPQESEPTLFALYFAFANKRPEGKLLCENEALSGSSLRTGDAVVVEAELEGHPKGSFAFKVTNTHWPNLDINDQSPEQVVTGRIEGAMIQDNFTKQNVRMTGSGWGEAKRHVNVIEPNARFYVATAFHEYELPTTKDYAVARKDDKGVLQILKPRELHIPDEDIEQKQQMHIGHIEVLMEKFGFDEFDFLKCEEEEGADMEAPEKSKLYEDKTFLAHYVHSVKDGNRFMIFNKKTRQMVACKYFDLEDQNMLQVAYADLTHSKDVKVEEDPVGSLTIAGIYRSCAAVVTFTSSPELGLDTVSYRPSDADAMKYLKLPNIGNRRKAFVPTPDIQLWPHNDVRVTVGGSGFHDVERKYPGTLEELKKIISAESLPDGKHVFQIGGKKIKIKNLDDVFEDILHA